MNIRQFEQYFKDAWKSIDDTLKGQKHSNIELMGDSAAQLAINQMQTEAQQKESELAYKRSSASNQVNLMRQAGMSRAGAINALNGGGSYTPAPVSLGSPNVGTAASNISQKNLDIASAVIGGVSSLASNVQQFQQLKNQQKQFKESLSLQREQLATDAAIKREQIQSSERIAQLQAHTGRYSADSAAGTARDRLEFDKKVYDDAAPLRRRQLEELDARIRNLDAQTNNAKVQTALYDLEYELSAENLDVRKIRNLATDLAAISQSQLDILFTESKRNAIQTLDPAELNNYMQYKMRMELVSLISTAIKEQEWSGPNAERAHNYLKLIEYLVIRK